MGRSARPTDDRRLVLFGGLLALAFVGIGVRLLMVQGLDAANYAQRGVDQRVREEILDAPRGTIYDRDSVELAVTINAETLVANPQDIENPRLAADLLAPYVNVEPDILADRLDGPGGFAYVARRLERSVASEIKDVIEEHDLNGFEFEDEAKRVYPSGALAAQVIGFVQVDENRGLGGIEYQFDEQLAGVPGRRIVERDPHGRVIPQGAFLIEPETPGADLVLTIDREIQFAADRALTAAVRRTNAVGGSIIVLDVQTGAILALANSPTFDPNQRAGVNPEALRNRAVTDTYEPGSTLKVVTVAAALDEGIVTARSLFEVPQEIEIHDKTYSDASKHEPQLSVAEIVAASSNVGTILIQGQLGNEAHQRYLSAFGLGQPTSTDFPAEAGGLLESHEKWCQTTCGPSTAIGYRVAVTPLQMAAVFATIANDGVWVEPHVVQAVIDADGERTDVEPLTRPVISEATARTMRYLLQGVIEAGTGWRARIDGYTAGGKTGTTEKFLPEEKAYSEYDRIASFIGMAPVDEPQIVVAVVLDSPSGEPNPDEDLRFGGNSAAPVFAEVALAALHDLGVTPDAR